MNLIILREAQLEFLAAISNYEAERVGLGRRFKDEVERSLHWVCQHPELYRLRPGGYRRMNVRVFPYYISYITRAETLWVLAIAHGSQKPGYWIRRRKDAL